MSEKKGIKETIEVLDFLEDLGVKGIEVADDGLDVTDIPKLLDMDLYKSAKEAIDEMDEVDDELKDLSEEEAQVIAKRAVEIVYSIKAAVKKAKDEEE